MRKNISCNVTQLYHDNNSSTNDWHNQYLISVLRNEDGMNQLSWDSTIWIFFLMFHLKINWFRWWIWWLLLVFIIVFFCITFLGVFVKGISYLLTFPFLFLLFWENENHKDQKHYFWSPQSIFSTDKFLAVFIFSYNVSMQFQL